MKLKILSHKVFAFIKRDFLTELSYRLQFVLSWLGIFLSVLIFYYISRLFEKTESPYLTEYGGKYFPFVFIGIAFSGYLALALGSFSANIRREQLTGTLEAMLVTPTKLSTIIISISLWNFIFNSISILIYLLFGVCFFGIDLTGANFFSAAIILILTVLPLCSIGIISAAFIMVFKRGDPIVWFINLFSGLFGGVYFPIAILPDSLRIVSYFLPITYSLKALRYALLRGYSFKMLLPEIAVLFAFSIVLLPLSISIFKYATKKAKVAGSLTHY
jgi:ABC-2 type transport system permease protein